MEQRKYLLEYIWLWVKTLLLYSFGGMLLGQFLYHTSFNKECGIFVAMIAFGMTFFNKVVTFNLFGNTNAVFVFWLLKVLLSAVIGIIAFPIVNIYYIVHIIIDIVKKVSSKNSAV